MAYELIRDPIYTQVNELLRDMIQRGEFNSGARFLTERQISERFGISRATANKALSALVAEGTLEFRKGVGTFVRSSVLDYDLRSLVSFTEKARTAGKTPATQVLLLERRTEEGIPTPIRDALNLPADEPTWYMERLRLADAVPVILERRYLRGRYCPRLTTEEISASLYELFTGKYGLPITGAEETIQAVNLSETDAEYLQTIPTTAALLVTAVGLLKGDEPLWYEETLYRGDAYEFRNRLGPVRHARPATGRLIGQGGPKQQ